MKLLCRLGFHKWYIKPHSLRWQWHLQIYTGVMKCKLCGKEDFWYRVKVDDDPTFPWINDKF